MRYIPACGAFNGKKNHRYRRFQQTREKMQRRLDFTGRLRRFVVGEGGTEGVRAQIARGASGSFALRMTDTALSFLINLMLARMLGAAGYGSYANAVAWVGLLGVLAMLGLDQLTVRNIATYKVHSAWGLIRGLIGWGHRTVLDLSLALGIAGSLVFWLLRREFDPLMFPTLWIAMLMVPVVSLRLVRQSAMRGLGWVVRGQLPEFVIYPVLFLLILSATYLLMPERFGAETTMGSSVAAGVVGLAIGLIFLVRALPGEVKHARPEYEVSTWMRSALPLMFLGGMNVLIFQTDIVMMGLLRGAEETGIYTVAQRGAQLIMFFAYAIEMALAPVISGLHAAGDSTGLQRVVTKSARVAFFTCLPVALALIIFGKWFLWVFGAEFMQGHAVLAIIGSGQLVKMALGSVMVLLVMTGHEREAAVATGVCALLNIGLNALLISLWGMTGAAVANMTTAVLWFGSMSVLAAKRSGIHSTILGRVHFGKGNNIGG